MTTIANARTRTAATIFIAQSCYSAGNIVAFTLTPIIAPALSGSNASAGLPNTLVLVGKAAAALPVGYLMDRIGRRYSLGASYLSGLLGAFLSIAGVVQESLFLFLVGATLFGLSRSGAELSRYVAAEVYPTARRARVLGIAVSAGTVGAVTGPLLVAPSQQWAARLGLTAYAGPFLATALLYGLAMAAVLAFLRPDPRELARQITADEAASDASPAPPGRSRSEVLAQPAIWVAILAMSIGFLVMVMLMVMTPLQMSASGYSANAISRVIMAHTIGMYAFAFLTGYLIDLFGRELMIIVGGLVLALACLLAPVAGREATVGAGAVPAGAGLELLLCGRLGAAFRPPATGRSAVGYRALPRPSWLSAPAPPASAQATCLRAAGTRWADPWGWALRCCSSPPSSFTRRAACCPCG